MSVGPGRPMGGAPRPYSQPPTPGKGRLEDLNSNICCNPIAAKGDDVGIKGRIYHSQSETRTEFQNDAAFAAFSKQSTRSHDENLLVVFRKKLDMKQNRVHRAQLGIRI